jgi:hypothetical protein
MGHLHRYAVISAHAPGQEVRLMPGRGTPFFLSYARADDGSAHPGTARSPDQMAERLFDDLRENLGQLIALPTGADIGFIDKRIRGGTNWPPDLAREVGTCRVLVALVSAPYLSSEWCGKEWYAFTQRATRRLPGKQVSDHQGCLIPVRWAPVEFGLPSVVADDMFFTPDSTPEPDLPELYRQNGIFGLLRMGLEDYYQILAWQLSMLISRVYHSLYLEPENFAPEDLRNAFEAGAP